MFDVLPSNTAVWEDCLEQNYESYVAHTHELIEKPKLFEFSEVEDPYRPKTDKEDLSPEEQKLLKENAKILRSIEKDVKRTRTELSFFR